MGALIRRRSIHLDSATKATTDTAKTLTAAADIDSAAFCRGLLPVRTAVVCCPFATCELTYRVMVTSRGVPGILLPG
ncbi:MAG TPA: hypothetical protein VI248_06755 [Kineosporiaceae bacterium]